MAWYNISNIENTIAILHIRELCSPAIYFYLTLLSLFPLKMIFRDEYHTCVIIRIWATEIPSLTHHDIMVDIEKLVLAGPCNPSFTINVIVCCEYPHKIVDNGTLKKYSAAGIIQFDWQPSWILTDLLKSKLFPKYFIKIHHTKTYV